MTGCCSTMNKTQGLCVNFLSGDEVESSCQRQPQVSSLDSQYAFTLSNRSILSRILTISLG